MLLYTLNWKWLAFALDHNGLYYSLCVNLKFNYNLFTHIFIDKY